MPHAAHLVLDGEQSLARFGIREILESILMLVALLRHEAVVEQFPVRTRKVRNVNLDVMAVVGRQRAVGFAKQQMLPDADFDPRDSAGAILARGRLCSHNLAVEPRDTVGGAPGHVEFDVRNSERDAAEALTWRGASDAISPRTPGLDEFLRLVEIETRPLQAFANPPQPPHQRLAIGHYDSNVTADNLSLVGRQMELAAAHVDPHVGGAGHQVRIARQAETGDVEDRRLLLIGNRYVDMFQRDDVAEVFGGSIESRLHKNLRSSLRLINEVK